MTPGYTFIQLFGTWNLPSLENRVVSRFCADFTSYLRESNSGFIYNYQRITEKKCVRSTFKIRHGKHGTGDG